MTSHGGSWTLSASASHNAFALVDGSLDRLSQRRESCESAPLVDSGMLFAALVAPLFPDDALVVGFASINSNQLLCFKKSLENNVF